MAECDMKMAERNGTYAFLSRKRQNLKFAQYMLQYLKRAIIQKYGSIPEE